MLIDKNSLPFVDEEFMNNTHFEDVDLINKLYEHIKIFQKKSSDENFNFLKDSYKSWQKHTIEHFKTEEDEMQKRAFFAYPFHKSEHDRNLLEIENIWNSFENSKDIEALKNYIEYDLTNWLINHIKSMDTITARFFKTGMSPCSMM
ncbi:Bacteriohemerythrin [Aliarcobacter thereius]|uniref:Bacteriohemerythrin n=1 Tax=Aliarcobacter thereius TaxID=544718 RepID=A0A1C0BA71_9BACT|nr:hemerythrin family protein [Aliarcobacter thereius]OCM00497.1 Bacteriohemerythrin [Aliarcobacter thereius]